MSLCLQISPAKGLKCTLEQGHTGDHVAGGVCGEILEVWAGGGIGVCPDCHGTGWIVKDEKVDILSTPHLTPLEHRLQRTQVSISCPHCFTCPPPDTWTYPRYFKNVKHGFAPPVDYIWLSPTKGFYVTTDIYNGTPRVGLMNSPFSDFIASAGIQDGSWVEMAEEKYSPPAGTIKISGDVVELVVEIV